MPAKHAHGREKKGERTRKVICSSKVSLFFRVVSRDFAGIPFLGCLGYLLLDKGQKAGMKEARFVKGALWIFLSLVLDMSVS
jgi:hypothetical protein